MRALVACESSGRVRDALRRVGVDAMSCDLLPSEQPGPHYTGDVRPLLKQPWDLVVAHPPCDYLANSGVRWRIERREWAEIWLGVDLFMACLNANAPRVAVENPIMHGMAKALGPGEASFNIHPWQFGTPEKKNTFFWTRGLPDLVPIFTDTSVWGGKAGLNAVVHEEGPGPRRKRNRSLTYQCIADAIADQWGTL